MKYITFANAREEFHRRMFEVITVLNGGVIAKEGKRRFTGD